MYLYIMDLRDSLMPGEYRDDENPLRLSNALIAGEPDDVEFMGCIANCNNEMIMWDIGIVNLGKYIFPNIPSCLTKVFEVACKHTEKYDQAMVPAI